MEEYLVPDSSVREYYSMIGAIAFVPEHDVAQNWSRRLLKPLLPADMDSFSSYYERSWIVTGSEPSLRSRDVEPTWCLLDAASTFNEHRRRMASRIQLLAPLLQPHSLEVPRLSEGGAVPHRRQTHEDTPPRAPWAPSSKVGTVRPAATEDCGRLRRMLWQNGLVESDWK